MGLTTLLDVDLELGMSRLDLTAQGICVVYSLAEQDREDVGALDQEPLDDLAPDGVEDEAGSHGIAVDETDELSFLDLEATEHGGAGGAHDGA